MASKGIMKYDLSNYHTFVAGGLGEIGTAIVNALVAANSSVTILYSSEKYSSRALKLEQEFHDKIDIIKVDYLNSENLYTNLSSHAMKGKTNNLVSTVGTGKVLDKYPHSTNEVKRIWDINYFSNRNLLITLSTLINESKQLNPKGLSSHVMTSSVASKVNVNAPIDYCSAKAALEVLVKTIAIRISPEQRVNVITPGHILTSNGTWGLKTKEDPIGVSHLINSSIPMNRLGNPRDLASLFLFLLSKQATYITGSSFTIDGGITSKS